MAGAALGEPGVQISWQVTPPILHQSSYTAQLTPPARFRGRRSTQSLLDELRRGWAPLGRAWLSADFVAGAALGEPGVQIPWQVQYTESPGSAAARVGAAGPQISSQYTEPPGSAGARVAECRFRGRLRGRRSAQSLLDRLPPLITHHHPSYTTHLLAPPILHHLSHTTHLTPLILHHSTHTKYLTPPISHHPSYTTHRTPLNSHLTLLISHTTHHTPRILHRSSHATHRTPLITRHSSHTTHYTPLITHHSSRTTHLTPLNLHRSSHTTHRTPLITHHSSHTTHHTPLI